MCTWAMVLGTNKITIILSILGPHLNFSHIIDNRNAKLTHYLPKVVFYASS